MGGLDDWMELLADRLDEALALRFPGSEGRWAAAGAPGNDEGAEERITLSLLALNPAPAARSLPRLRSRGGPAALPPLVVDGELLVTPRRTLTSDHGERLRTFSAAVEWLHANPRLTGAGQAGFAAGDAIGIEPVPLTLDQVAALIQACPWEGMPFALYRLRGMMISV
jgi:hypothetical protein